MTSSANKIVIVVVGPTAVGKTSFAIELASKFSTEIISADSRQCFKELNIGVARPTEKELAVVPHHFIASHSIHENVNAGTFEQYALNKVGELFQRHNAVIMVGGTGLYIKAFCEGLDEIPEVSRKTREQIISSYQKNGLQWLQKEIEQKDPEFYRSGEIKNPHRLMRALEVVEATGRSIVEFRRRQNQKRDFDIIKIGLELPKEDLHRNIKTRVDEMIDAGLLDEVERLSPYKEVNALQTVGYSEIFAYLEGKISREEAVDRIKRNTRQYAKRQMTWFKKDREVMWFNPSDTTQIENYLRQMLTHQH